MAITQVTISIDTTNAAFCDPFTQDPADDYALAEVSSVVRKALNRGLSHNQPLWDVNGNQVGVVTVTRKGES